MTRASEEPLPLVLQRFDILKLFTVDTKEQNFSCQFLLEFILPEGTDPSTDKNFPVDTNSESFKLSAAWYLKKIEPVGESKKIVDQNIMLRDGNMLIQVTNIEAGCALRIANTLTPNRSNYSPVP